MGLPNLCCEVGIRVYCVLGPRNGKHCVPNSILPNTEYWDCSCAARTTAFSTPDSCGMALVDGNLTN